MPAEWKLDLGPGGAPLMVFDNGVTRAELALNGAHLLGLLHRPSERRLLWLAEDETFVPGRPIRGGVPLVFPWFGLHRRDANLPRHGFARNLPWSVEQAAGPRLLLGLTDSDLTRVLWPHRFEARLEVAIEDTAVGMALRVRNTGDAPLSYEGGFHPYFTVSSAGEAAVDGLDGCTFDDKVDGGRSVVKGSIHFPGRVDRVCEAPRSWPVTLRDGSGPRVRVSATGATEVVVWNPGPGGDGSAAPPFVCVEPANCYGHSITLAPGESHELASRFEMA